MPTAPAGQALTLVPPSAPWVTVPRGAVLHRLSGRSMGTVWRLVLADRPDALLASVQALVDACLAELARQMSHWEADSELSRFNRLAVGESLALSADFARVMQLALRVAEQSNGAFDPALGDTVERWGFGATGRFDSPGFSLSVAEPVELSRWRSLRLDGTRLQQPGGCRLDLSAIAKGHAVDAAATALRAHGHRNFLFELGGELRGEGLKADGQPWWVALERPPGAEHLPPLRAALIGQSVATSGDYRQGFRDAQGRWRSHTIDPRTGVPVEHALASVSVLHPSCAEADALATALFVLGPEAGMAWADQHGVAAWFTARGEGDSWQEIASAALREWRED